MSIKAYYGLSGQEADTYLNNIYFMSQLMGLIAFTKGDPIAYFDQYANGWLQYRVKDHYLKLKVTPSLTNKIFVNVFMDDTPIRAEPFIFGHDISLQKGQTFSDLINFIGAYEFLYQENKPYTFSTPDLMNSISHMMMVMKTLIGRTKAHLYPRYTVIWKDQFYYPYFNVAMRNSRPKNDWSANFKVSMSDPSIFTVFVETISQKELMELSNKFDSGVNTNAIVKQILSG
jgi:hypothetical protein